MKIKTILKPDGTEIKRRICHMCLSEKARVVGGELKCAECGASRTR